MKISLLILFLAVCLFFSNYLIHRQMFSDPHIEVPKKKQEAWIPHSWSGPTGTPVTEPVAVVKPKTVKPVPKDCIYFADHSSICN